MIPPIDLLSERENEVEQKLSSSSSANDAISGKLHVLYMNQIAAAQEFLNENHLADLSRIQCLLRKMIPEPYHKVIEELKENQDPAIIYNIFGGIHQHAPNATKVEQKK